jgi:two-component system NtrC family sensor kinase
MPVPNDLRPRQPFGAAERLLRLLLAAAIVLPVTVLAAGGTIAWNSRQQEAWERSSRLVDLIYESVSRLFDTHLMVLDQVQALVDGHSDTQIAADQPALHRELAAMLVHLPHVRDLFVVDRQGRAIVDAVNLPAPTQNDLNDRDYVQYFAHGGTGLFVSRPGLRKVDQRAFFALAIRRHSPDGQYNGLIAASVNPEYFQSFFAHAEAAYNDFAGRVMTLRRTDGLLLVRAPADASVTAAPPDVQRQFQDPDVPGGRFKSITESGAVRLAAWRRLSGVNMIVVTSVPRAAVVRDWLNGLLPHVLFGVPATLALVVLILLTMRRTREAEAAIALADHERQRREQAEEASRQTRHLEALGKLTGGVAHDFNNLLAVMLGSAELARTRPPEAAGRLLDNIIHAGQRAAALTRQLLTFARRQPVAPRVLDLRAELPRSLPVLRSALGHTIGLELRTAHDLWPVEIDPHEWEIALLNLAVNARDAMPLGGAVVIDAANRVLQAGEIAAEPGLSGAFVAVTVRDGGLGMPPHVAARAFEPFFTTKEVGRGTGLGLSQVYGFVHQAGGSATIDSTVGRGTAITLLLPRSATPAVPAMQPSAAPAAVATSSA